MKKKQNEAKFEKARPYKSRESNLEREERYKILRAPLPTMNITCGRSWGGSALCSDDGKQRLYTPGTRAYELMWHAASDE